jgi:hypothetical protein
MIMSQILQAEWKSMAKGFKNQKAEREKEEKTNKRNKFLPKGLFLM